ncbi:ornithine aminomutase subunit alpha [Alkalicella caledoniensis]|uniref:Ornithine aminomutase subunit alpha n=1 Tax=Alkalicella caledoniensis TaxID=2731377 RepID=A0A7G9W7T1_ALKCA|nr:ornithine aminomutase subunit alpha [Alkalicella caledoniensis]QNO14743.1 ornithine aminomutase subunit alpha [Alkalicella caledoniensis]
MERVDTYLEKKEKFKDLSDEQLKQRFWDLLDQIVTPMVDNAATHTSPAVERSVLLRMGFNSLDCKVIVDRCIEHGLMGKGAGHVVLKMAEKLGLDYKEAGQKLIDNEDLWEEAKAIFGGVK